MSGHAPAQPTAILRGHRGQVNAAAFVRLNDGPSPDAPSTPSMTADTRLATGDSDGFVVLWDLAIVRPRAVWRAHENSILGLAGWDADAQIVTHGRDHKLIVWQVGVADEARLSTELPLDGESPRAAASQAGDHPKPWIVHVLEVNTMNFCTFTWCGYAGTAAVAPVAMTSKQEPPPPSSPQPTERLVAVPNTLTLEAVDIYHLPSQRRINTVKLGAKEGMIMAVALFYAHSSASTLILIAAFENGAAVVAALDGTSADGPPTILYRAKPHSQPILSLDVAPDQSYFLTSAADAVIAKHPIPLSNALGRGKETAAAATSKPAAPPQPELSTQPLEKPVSLLSAALAKEPATYIAPPSAPLEVEPETLPLKVADTKHAGQQGLRIRSDGRVFATAGWDARVRVYSAKTMKELAVLKWHQQGCFAVAFAPVASDTQDPTRPAAALDGQQSTAILPAATSTPGSLTKARGTRAVSVKERRLQHAVTAHWLAVGSKDSKLSLWDIF